MAHSPKGKEPLILLRMTNSRPNMVWLTDIMKLDATSIVETGGKMEVLTILDVADGRIVGWACHSKINDAHVVNLLGPLVAQIKRSKELFPENETPFLIIHSDRGEQFRSNRYWNFSVIKEASLL